MTVSEKKIDDEKREYSARIIQRFFCRMISKKRKILIETYQKKLNFLKNSRKLLEKKVIKITLSLSKKNLNPIILENEEKIIQQEETSSKLYTEKSEKIPEEFLEILEKNTKFIENFKPEEFSKTAEKIIFENQEYHGQIQDKLPHGYGELYNNEKNFLYTGNFSNGEPKGKFMLISKNEEKTTIFYSNDENSTLKNFIPYNGKITKIDKEENTIFEGEIFNGEYNNGIFQYSNGDIYEGQFINGLREGEGKLSYINGDIYTGNWKENYKSGKGILKYFDNGILEGNFFENGEKSEGVFEMKNGVILEGIFKNGILFESGVIKYPNGTFYHGESEENYQNGHGLEKNADGSWYEGAWSQGKRHGNGTYYWPDGSRFEGEFENDAEIRGEYFDISGEKKFEGKFEEILIKFKNYLRFNNGNFYRGDIEYGEPNGKGVLFNDQAGIIYKGEWKNGLFNGNGVLFSGYSTSTRKVYEGEFCLGFYDGKGKSYNDFSKKLEVQGDFRLGQLTGKCTKFYPNGSIKYKGGCKNGKMHGYGEEYHSVQKNNSQKIRFKGNFFEGKKQGKGVEYSYEGDVLVDGGFENDNFEGYGFYPLGGEEIRTRLQNGDFLREGEIGEGEYRNRLKYGEWVFYYGDGSRQNDWLAGDNNVVGSVFFDADGGYQI